MNPPSWKVSGGPPAGSDALLAPLRAARDRYARQIAMDGAAWAAVGCALVLGTLELVRYLGRGRAPIPALSGLAVVVTTGLALCIGIAGVFIHLRRSVPGLLQVARRADRHFELDERLSTALELGRPNGDGQSGIVISALAHDAERHASRVRPESLVPLRVPRAAWFVPVVLVAVVALELAPAKEASGRGGSSAGALAALESTETISQAADYLQEEAAERDDPSLVAAAEALRKLSQSISQGSLSAEQADAALAQALGQAQQSLLENDEGSEGIPEVVSGDQSQPGSSGTPGAQNRDGGQSGKSGSEGRAALDSLMSRLASNQSESSDEDANIPPAMPGMQGPGDVPAGGRKKDGTPPPGGAQSQFQQLSADQLAGLDEPGDDQGSVAGNGIGKSSGSGSKGAGELPPMESVARRQLELSLERGSASRRAGGEELPPDTKFTAVADQIPPTGAWRAGRAQPIPSDHVGVSYRALASRYFLSMTQQPPAPASR